TGFKLKWSLERKEYTYLIYVLFVFSLVVFTLTNMKANQLKEQVIEKMNTASTLTERQYRNTDLSGYLVSVADYVLGKGAIKRMEKTQEGLTFYISFKNEEFAQTFLKEKGGRYEQGQVIYTVSFASK
ncbi:MAG: hypothetical protein NZ942_04080, partial [Candidatus Aenigmarchaeota archaeon]|nr:hypothetical protein [Candidatus Aenigmarchaeota archaeon]